METEPRVPGAMTRWLLALLRHFPPWIQGVLVWALLRLAWLVLLIVVFPVVIVVFAVVTAAYAVLNAVLGSPSGGVGAALAYGWLGLWVLLSVVVTVRIWHSIPAFSRLRAYSTDGSDALGGNPGDPTAPDRPAEPPRFVPPHALSDEQLRLLEDRGGELSVYEPESGAVLVLASRGRRRGSTYIDARIPTWDRYSPQRPRATHAGLLALGWKRNAAGHLVRSWTIVGAVDRATVRRDVGSALDTLADDGLVTAADLAIAYLPAGAIPDGAFEVGCLLSVVGSSLGAVGGLLALALLTTAVDSAGVAIVAFILAFVGGFVVGFFGASPALNVAIRIGPLRPWRDELLVLWSSLAAGLVAAAIPWLLARSAGAI
jgi:hypothetical protein